jgi:hypothetical protein
MTISIASYLDAHGPTRGSVIAKALIAAGGTPEAARQRLARVAPPIWKFPVKLLPKNEGFYYLQDQRNTDQFWDNLMRDLRATGSIYGLAMDGLAARGHIVPYNQYPVITGAPVQPMTGQVNSESVRKTLIAADMIQEFRNEAADAYIKTRFQPVYTDVRSTPEAIILDAVRDWARKLGFASYNTIAIRGEAGLKPIGPFQYDLSGPSWLAPLPYAPTKPGFIVADVFAGGTLDEHQVQYFIRKVQMTGAMRGGPRLLPFLIADSFTGVALKAGHAAGISLATPTILFGRRVGAALATLLDTLKNVAAYASADTPDRIIRLVNDLSDIEGKSLNLRGALFEMIVGYLARREAVSIEMGTLARDAVTGKQAEIDVLAVFAGAATVIGIECKGRDPGGTVGIEDVQNWLQKIAVQRAFLANHPTLREAEHRFEIWTSGVFESDALALLESEKKKRTKAPIGWKQGADVLGYATGMKQKAVADMFRQHFMEHPYAEYAASAIQVNWPSGVASTSERLHSQGPAPYGGLMSLPSPSDKFD